MFSGLLVRDLGRPTVGGLCSHEVGGEEGELLCVRLETKRRREMTLMIAPRRSDENLGIKVDVFRQVGSEEADTD